VHPRFRRILTAATALLAAGPAGLAAQQATPGVVSGRVLDRDTQQPIAGAQVTIVGTSRGTLSGDDGRFRIGGIAPGSQLVRALRIGYQALARRVTVTAGETVNVDIALGVATAVLDEVTVTATGEQERKRESGNVVSTVQPTTETLAATTNATDLLEARAPGVFVQGSGGTTGSGSRIRIRGASSISLSNEPLIIIDGIRAYNAVGANNLNGSTTIGVGGQVPSTLNEINPEDIENIEILKGPAAAALYGTAAANGVIQITTRHGRSGKTRWNTYGEYGQVKNLTSWPANYSQPGTLTNGKPTGACTLDRRTRNLCTPTGGLLSFNPLVQASPFVTGFRQLYGLNVTGGGENTSFYISGDYGRDQGVFAWNNDQRVNLRANVNSQLRDNLNIAVSSGYITDHLRLPQNDNDVLGIISGGLLGSSVFDSASQGYLAGQPPSAIAAIDTRQDVNRFINTVTANFQALKWLSATGTAGLDFLNRHDLETVPPNKVFFGSLPDGYRTSNPYNIFDYTANGTVSANFGLTENLRSTTSVGTQFNKEVISGTRAHGEVLLGGTGSLQGAAARFQVGEANPDNRTLGFLGREELAWRDRLFLSAALRTDNNSAFGKNFGWVKYPAASVSYVISEEPYFPRVPTLSSLRLRAAYGRSGRQPNFRDAITYFTSQSLTQGAADIPGLLLSGVGTASLKPEQSAETEFGLDAGFFSDRISIQVTHYDKTTQDLLVAVPIPPSAGVTGIAASETEFRNLGRANNNGWELGLNAAVVNRQNFEASFALNGSTNHNKLLELGRDAAGNPLPPVIFNNGSGLSQHHQVGYPLGGIWARPVTWHHTGNGPLTRAEVTVGPDEVYLGNTLPTWGLTFTPRIQLFRWLTVTALLDHEGGFKQYNLTERFRCTFGNCRAASDPSAPLQQQAAYYGAILGSDALYVENSDYTKLREVAVTLGVSSRIANLMRAQGASLTVAGRNLHTWTKYSGFDPELSSVSGTNFSIADFLTLPPSRIWTARLTLTY
jgi:TonB-linked SusC/RagA family outer membrane protein